MRFLQSEYKSIVSAISASGLEESDFSFIKKRGRLNINHLSSKQQFHFFRKTVTILNDQREWEKQSSFNFGEDKETFNSDSFDTVVAALKLWLDKLPK